MTKIDLPEIPSNDKLDDPSVYNGYLDDVNDWVQDNAHLFTAVSIIEVLARVHLCRTIRPPRGIRRSFLEGLALDIEHRIYLKRDSRIRKQRVRFSVS